MEKITHHRDLATAIAGKKILHLNSLGKDAALCLEWLNKYAVCSEIISVWFAPQAKHPDDLRYWKYQQRKYPKTRFLMVPNLIEMNDKMEGRFQSPLFINYVVNNQDYLEFDFKKACEELRVTQGMDYICSGLAKYEGMGRALYLRRVGLLDAKNKKIFPMGLMDQKQVFSLIKATGIKLHPSYKITPESHDTASYFKMRNAFVTDRRFEREIFRHYPLMALDRYRYEVLFKK